MLHGKTDGSTQVYRHHNSSGYIIHYPLMYLFYSWVWTNGISFDSAIPVMGCMLVAIPLLAWAALKFYDEPLRRRLTDRWLSHRRDTR